MRDAIVLSSLDNKENRTYFGCGLVVYGMLVVRNGHGFSSVSQLKSSIIVRTNSLQTSWLLDSNVLYKVVQRKTTGFYEKTALKRSSNTTWPQRSERSIIASLVCRIKLGTFAGKTYSCTFYASVKFWDRYKKFRCVVYKLFYQLFVLKILWEVTSRGGVE